MYIGSWLRFHYISDSRCLSHYGIERYVALQLFSSLKVFCSCAFYSWLRFHLTLMLQWLAVKHLRSLQLASDQSHPDELSPAHITHHRSVEAPLHWPVFAESLMRLP